MSSATMNTGGPYFAPPSSTSSSNNSATKQQHYSGSMHEAPPDRSTPLLIRTPRAATSVMPSMDCYPMRRLDKRDHRSFSADWINSPLLESFASFHSALNTVHLHDPTTASADMASEFPYLTSCWPLGQEEGGQAHSALCGSEAPATPLGSMSTMEPASASSTASTSASSLAMEDWDMLKMRSLSTEFSGAPMDSFAPFLFPMETDHGHVHSEGTPYPEPHHSFSPPHQQLQPQVHHHKIPEAFPAACPTIAHHSPHGGLYADPSVNVQPRQPHQWLLNHPQQHQQEVHYHQQSPETSTARAMTAACPEALPQLLVYAPPAPPQVHHHPVYQPPKPSIKATPPRSLSTSGGRPGLPLADVQLLTKLNSCYWKNGRKNLQCFPICPEHNDFYSMKMSNRKHTTVGVCRGPVYSHVFLPASPKPPSSTSRTMGQHMKYEYGVGASGSGGSAYEVFVLGKFERVPQKDDSDELEQLLPAATNFTNSVGFESFRYSCFQAVEMEERRLTTRSAQGSVGVPDHIVRSTWFFLPDVWKVQPMLKKKRKATRSAPAQAFPFCFRVFVYIRDPSSSSDSSNPSYRFIASTTSAFFELYSTRTVDRVKRKYWGQVDGEEQDEDAPMDAPIATTPSAIHIAKRPSRS